MKLWQYRSSQGDEYELRKAGNSLRLYRNAVFHSQYNASRLHNGGVWDLLWLPAFFRAPQKTRRVLMLGVGLGAALLKLRALLPDVEIVAVDIDPVHLALAQTVPQSSSKISKKRLLDVSTRAQQNALDMSCEAEHGQYICADAIAWLQAYRGPKFDLVVDDLFIDASASGVASDPSRVIALDAILTASKPRLSFHRRSWLHHLQRVTSKQGLVVVNCESPASARKGIAQWREMFAASEVGAQCSLSTPLFENRIAVFSHKKLPLTARVLKQNLLSSVPSNALVSSASVDRLLRATKIQRH